MDPSVDAASGKRRAVLLFAAALLIAAVAAVAVIGAGRFLEAEPLPVSQDAVRWNEARELEDWPGRGRPEPDLGPVQVGVNFPDRTADTAPAPFPEVDLVGFEFRDCGWFSSHCVFFTPARGPSPKPGPQERWLAYGIVVDDDGDGRADYRFGVDNAGGAEGNARMWRTDLSTGETLAYVDTLEDPQVMDGVFPASTDPEGAGHIFAVSTGKQFRFYVWAAAIVDDQIVATDYAPDAGWVEQ